MATVLGALLSYAVTVTYVSQRLVVVEADIANWKRPGAFLSGAMPRAELEVRFGAIFDQLRSEMASLQGRVLQLENLHRRSNTALSDRGVSPAIIPPEQADP